MASLYCDQKLETQLFEAYLEGIPFTEMTIIDDQIVKQWAVDKLCASFPSCQQMCLQNRGQCISLDLLRLHQTPPHIDPPEPWTINQDKTLLRMLKKLAIKWDEMSWILEGRSVNPIKNRWYGVRAMDGRRNRIQWTPSPFVWNVDETRVGCPKKCISSKVIVSPKAGPGCVESLQVKDDAQLAPVAAISAFGNAGVSMFITKVKTFDKIGLGDQMLLDGHEYIIQSVNKMSITEVLFTDWMNRICFPRFEEPRCRLNFEDPVVLICDAPGRPLIVSPPVVLERIATPEAEIDTSFIYTAGDVKHNPGELVKQTGTRISAVLTLQPLGDLHRSGRRTMTLVRPRA
jgi:hypothetical protein